jgi:hypothetical protein
MEWKLFLDQFDSPRVGMYLDVGNCLLYAPAEDYIDLLGEKYIKAVHIKFDFIVIKWYNFGKKKVIIVKERPIIYVFSCG